MGETIYEVLDRIETDDEVLAIGPGGTSLEFLQAVYRHPAQPLSRRIRCAVAALPFEYPKLAVTAHVDADGFAAKLEAARKRSAQVLTLRGDDPQLVGAEPADSGVAHAECAGDIG